MSFGTRVGMAVFAVVLGSGLVLARADEKASKSADAKAEKSARAEADNAADKTKATAEKAAAKGDAAKGDAKEAKETKKAVKLVQPWNKLTSLTEEQKDKIYAIHQKALAETNAIKKREKTEIEALLTDGQKSELREIAAQEKKANAEKKPLKKDADDAAPKVEKKAKDAA